MPREVLDAGFLEIGASATTIREHLSMVESAGDIHEATTIDALSQVEPTLAVYLRVSDEARSLLSSASTVRESPDVLERLISTFERLGREAHRFSGPWDFSR